MKKKIIILFSLIILVALIIFIVLNQRLNSVENILFEVINSERLFVDENSNETFFNEYKIDDRSYTQIEKYTFVDLDKDGKDELIVYTTSEYGFYLIFKYEKELDIVFGYKTGIRSISDLKVDGEFKGSGGAGLTYFNNIFFENNKLYTKTLAKADRDLDEYTIADNIVSEEEFKKYEQDWNKKQNCIWKKNTKLVNDGDFSAQDNLYMENEENKITQESKVVGIYQATYYNIYNKQMKETIKLLEGGIGKYECVATEYAGKSEEECTWTIDENNLITITKPSRLFIDGIQQEPTVMQAQLLSSGNLFMDNTKFQKVY